MRKHPVLNILAILVVLAVFFGASTVMAQTQCCPAKAKDSNTKCATADSSKCQSTAKCDPAKCSSASKCDPAKCSSASKCDPAKCQSTTKCDPAKCKAGQSSCCPGQKAAPKEEPKSDQPGKI